MRKKESDEKKPQVAYLSLYGVSSLGDIKNAIYMSFIENLCEKGVLQNKGSQIIKGAKLVKNTMNFCKCNSLFLYLRLLTSLID